MIDIKKTSKPEISLLFKDISAGDLVDVGPQLNKVLAFQKETNKGQQQLYQTFQDIRDFERKFRAIIAKFLKDQEREDKGSEGLELQKPTGTEGGGKVKEKGNNESSLFDSSERKFLNNFISKQHNGKNTFSSAEAARFRLLACNVFRSGNDSETLGTHDANLVYRDFRAVELSAGERDGLLSTAIENLDSSTVPLWHWIFHPDFQIRSKLPLQTLRGEEKRRRNAFRLLAKLGIAPSNFETAFDKNQLLELWFAKHLSADHIISVLDYLGAVGDEGLKVDWREFIGKPEANIASAAVRAYARIKVRSNPTEALRFVAQHEGTDLGVELTKELLASINMVETEVLRNCLNNRTNTFLHAIATELFQRTALTEANAQLLFESADADIRLIGVLAIAKQNSEISEVDARKILVKPRKPNFGNLFAPPQDMDLPGEKVFKEYKINSFGKLQFEQLILTQRSESFYSTEATLALYRHHFGKAKGQIEQNLLDGFEKFFNDRLNVIHGALAKPSEAVFRFVKEELLQATLETYCSRATKSNLTLVRTVLDKHVTKFSAEIAEFLGKYGQFEDASRLTKLANNLKYGLGLSYYLRVDHAADRQLAAKAILSLGAKRIADAWSLDMPDSVRVQFVVQMSKKLFLGFDDQRIIAMLLSDSDVVRETVALKAVLYLPKARLRRILNAYYKVDESYYYNAIFWLDLGLAADRGTSKTIALREIAAK